MNGCWYYHKKFTNWYLPGRDLTVTRIIYAGNGTPESYGDMKLFMVDNGGHKFTFYGRDLSINDFLRVMAKMAESVPHEPKEVL